MIKAVIIVLALLVSSCALLLHNRHKDKIRIKGVSWVTQEVFWNFNKREFVSSYGRNIVYKDDLRTYTVISVVRERSLVLLVKDAEGYTLDRKEIFFIQKEIY